MSKSAISIVGFIATDLKVREVTGHRIVDVSVPVTPQKLVNGKWEDSGDTVWYKAAFWDEHGDGVLQSVQKGDLVTISGTPKLDLYTKDNEARGSIAILFPVIALVVRKPARGQGQSAPVADEPWASSSPAYVWNMPDESSQIPF